ncbi:MAG TPA: hypothetical protein VFI79_04420, partial [Gemmatimonadales bacterium]|nr:hypothetical protein [Gemmatimonadales bacterium]
MVRVSLAALALALLLLRGAPLAAQDSTHQEPRRPVGYHALNIGVSGVGLSIGNSRRWTGVRINFQDNQVERVNGIGVTIWAAKYNEGMELNGLALGLAGPVGGRFTGVTIGGAGAVADQEFRGVTVAGLGVVSNGDMKGVNLSGLGTVANRDMWGVNAAGLGLVANGRMDGINLGGLAAVANGRMRGLNVGGLAVVANGSLYG